MNKHVMIEDIETVVRKMSSEQKNILIEKIKISGFYLMPWFFNPISKGLHIFVKEPKEGHPRAFNSYLPVGFIGKNAELVNLSRKFPEDYHSRLREIYYSIEKDK